jgi:hypothetical protein
MPDWQQKQDEAFRAIGLYVAAFSVLVATMRGVVIMAVTEANPKKRKLAQLALGGQSAQQVADAFFAICRAEYELDQEERQIEKCLRLQVDDEIRRRNRVAHGDWFVMMPSLNEPNDQVAELQRVKASRQEPFVTKSLTVAQIMEYVESAWLLDQIVGFFGASCAGNMHERVSTLLEINDGRVVNSQAHAIRTAQEKGS